MADAVRFVWDDRELAALARSEAMRRHMAGRGGQVTRIARSDAPRRTGAGAASIRGETVLEDAAWEVRVSWDQLHYYMRMQDLGTRHLQGTHFLEHALDRYARP